MGLHFQPEKNGGRILRGDTPYGRFRVEWDAEGKLVSESMEIREPAPQGLGDTIAKITKAVGIKPCGGCKKRQEALNKMMPYKTGSGQ